jgi:hypothetical protein
MSQTLQVSVDFRDEVDELHGFLQTLKPEVWDLETGFMHWTPWDVVAHLHFYDLVSMVAVEGEEAFAAERQSLFTAIGGRNSHANASPISTRRACWPSGEARRTLWRKHSVHRIRSAGCPGSGLTWACRCS